MTTKQRIKLNMYLSVRNISNTFREAIKKIPKFDVAFTLFMGVVDEIQAVSEQQGINKTGLTADKNKLKEKLVALTLKYSNKLSFLAKSITNETLLREVKVTESDLSTVSGVILRDRAQVIHDKAEANLTMLQEQGITAETQKQFMELIQAYNKALSMPRSGIAERSQATKKLSMLYARADDALLMLDMAVESVKDEQPDFYPVYKTSRKLVDANYGKLVLRGVAIDISSKEPIKGVFFRFRPKELKTGSLREYTKKTANKGRFNMKSMLPGNYQVAISKPGYKAKDSNLTIIEGKTSEIIVELEKE